MISLLHFFIKYKKQEIYTNIVLAIFEHIMYNPEFDSFEN